MDIPSVIKLFVQVASFVGFFLATLLPTLYIAQSFFTEAKSKKGNSKAVQEYIETKMQEHRSIIEAHVNQRLAEASDRMHHQYNTKQSTIEDLHTRMEALEAMFKKEMHAHQLILDSKSLLLELTIQSREARMDGKEKTHPLDHSRVNQTHQMKSLSAAVRGVADATETFNDLLPRVLALETAQVASQQTAAKSTEFEKQIKDLSQKVDQINATVKDCVQRSMGDQFTLKTLVKLNRAALETKMNEMEADIRGQLVTHNHQITDTIKVVANASIFVNKEFRKILELVHNVSAYCANLKETSDLVGAQLQYMLTRLTQLEQWLTQTASSDNEDMSPHHQIIFY